MIFLGLKNKKSSVTCLGFNLFSLILAVFKYKKKQVKYRLKDHMVKYVQKVVDH